MSLKGLFTFEGRINRAPYFLISLLSSLISTSMDITLESVDNPAFLLFYILIVIAIITINVCITVQRLHDIGRSGYHYFLFFIPIYNIYLGLVLIFKRGIDGPNEYGEDPLALNYD